MKVSSLKVIFQKFGFFKDYSSLVVPVLLTILAALLFIPTTLMQHSLAVKMEQQSVSKIAVITSLGNAPSERQWQEEEKEVFPFEKTPMLFLNWRIKAVRGSF